MPLLEGDPLTQIAFSVFENKGIFAVLLGSGLSRTAHIPTGWEITLDLVRRVGLAQGAEEQTDWAAWYRDQTKQEPNYSTLIEELAASPEERRAILHGYIEPTEEDRVEGRKVPTVAHRAIASMVAAGYIRVIITTNFDRLMENALRERGIEPTIVSSVDALLGAEPLTHSRCYLLKLHGDYKDARILNTESELAGYPAQYDALLDRIFDEHGLIVSGWSGEWDHALRAAFLRAPNRRYSTFWAARGDLGTGASESVEHRHARVTPIANADAFFASLWQRIETLEQSQRQNPLSIELLVNSTKRFLAKPESRIQLDDLFAIETERLIAQLDSVMFAVPPQWDQDVFRKRVRLYESASEGLASMAGVLGRWGDGPELSIVVDVIRTLYAHGEKVAGGITVFLNLRTYPAVLVFMAYALGAVRAERWNALHRFLNAILSSDRHESIRMVEALFAFAWKGTENDAWKQLEDMEKRKTPHSDHSASLFGGWSRPFVGLTPDFELLFERFEMLASLAHLEQHDTGTLQESLSNGNSRDFVWMPVGRSSWDSSRASKLIQELKSDALQLKLLDAGFARRDPQFIDLFITNFGRFASRMSW